MKFKLCAFADESASDIEGQIKALKRNKIKQIEIRNVNSQNIIKCENIKAVKSQLDDAGISVWSIGSAIGKISIDDDFIRHIDDFKRAINAAHILNTTRIRMFSFFMPNEINPDSYREEVFARTQKLLDIADEEGVICCHENEKGIYGDTKERCLDILTHFSGRLKFVFDAANFVQCQNKPSQVFDELFPYIDYIHIKDAMLSNGTVVPSGYGDGDIECLLKKLSAVDKEITLSVEPHLSLFDGLNNLQNESLLHTFVYKTNVEAFDAGVDALKVILQKGGYEYE